MLSIRGHEGVQNRTVKTFAKKTWPKEIISPFTSTQKSLNSESSSVLQLYTPEHEDVAGFITSVLFLLFESMFSSNSGKSFIPSSIKQVWIAECEISHFGFISPPASRGSFLSASGTAENQTHAIGSSIH